MTYTIEESDQTKITIYDRKVVYRVHIFRAGIEDIEPLAETLVKDAEVEKQREGEPQ